MKPFGILAWPAWTTKKDNPYNFLLYSNMQPKEYHVYEFQFNLRNICKWAFSNRFKVFHMHWPTNILAGKDYWQSYRYVITLQLFLICIRLLNKKVVWTVHNLEAHESKFPSLQKKLDRILYKNVDGFISLNEAGVDIVKTKAGNHGQVKYIPHPHYQQYYPDAISRTEARTRLGIPLNEFVFLFLGQIRKYKNVTGLVQAFNNMPGKDAFLLIAGSVHQEVKEELAEITANNSRIKLIDSFIKDEDLQLYMKCADLVVTPYDKIFNSGSIFLNLSFNKPTLAPALAAMPGLQKIVGEKWIKLYDGQISGPVLLAAMANLKKGNQEHEHPNLRHFDPVSIAEQTTSFYRSLAG